MEAEGIKLIQCFTQTVLAWASLFTLKLHDFDNLHVTFRELFEETARLTLVLLVHQLVRKEFLTKSLVTSKYQNIPWCKQQLMRFSLFKFWCPK